MRTIARAAAEIAPIPRGDDGEPVFREPWEAQAFAMTLALYERGLFTWTEWAAALSAAIKQRPSGGGLRRRLDLLSALASAIEQLVSDKGIASEAGAGGAPRRLGPRGTRNPAWAADPARERSTPLICTLRGREWRW